MAILRFLIFAALLAGTYGKAEPSYNEIDRFLQLFNFSLPTIKIPDLLKPEKTEDAPIPNILPTALPIKIPTIKLPTLPHILPTPFPPKPKDSDETNIVCDVCEFAVTNLKLKFSTLEKKVRKVLSDTVSKICTKLLENPQLFIFSVPCNMIQTDLIKNVFDRLDKFEEKILPTTVCKFVPFCKYPKA
ncbi:Protein CBR-SPP-11 [Caenorhabditis briggsae]|uniref:Protein CBR-SPP-11 n=2 Tax=Caenorhabditis briggsae TaxID=6238 RepID=A8WTU1_CAEBR|nr:Protein CBR-SPP-11 [Caenorhabditis briggsae]ULU06545.1 hypothetical protein L3Y34_018410 [Caenorhabditis briggsae]CAP23903.2 Protein CBR-SPP-11 [Caenorhabditis briggsae]